MTSELTKLLKLDKDLYGEKKELLMESLELLKSKSLGKTVDTPGLFQQIKNFFHSEFYKFIKKYLFLIILLTIIFYIIIYINNNSNLSLIVSETKILFYIVLFFLCIVINDILSTPQENLNKFISIIIISLIFIYLSNFLIEKYVQNSTYKQKLIYSLLGGLTISIITIIIIYFTFERQDSLQAFSLYQNFNNGINKNFYFMIFIFIYVHIYQTLFYYTDWNTYLSDILSPTILGAYLLFFVYCIMIFLAAKIKIINNKQYLNMFIALFAITILMIILNGYIFLHSSTNICDTNQENTIQQQNIIERITICIIISIIIVLWLDDTRNWHELGSILYLFASIITFACILYYSKEYPSISGISTWLFIEWIILFYRQNANSKHSFHFSFMKT